MENKNKVANPGPLGLLGFGMTTILLNLVNIGFVDMSMVVIAMGIALGGLAQIVAGIFEFKNNNLFGATAFTAYGFFWLSFVFIKVGMGTIPAADLTSMGFYLLLWAVFTFFMAIGTITHNTITKLVFWSLTALFLTLSIGDFTGIAAITKVAGGIGILTGLFAMYSAVGTVVNNELGKDVLPL